MSKKQIGLFKILNKDNVAIYIGFALIILVFVITVSRSFGEKDAVSNNVSTKNQQKTDYKTISSKDLQRKLWNNEEIKIIDIRSYDDYITEHILDSINIAQEEIDSNPEITSMKNIILVGSESQDEVSKAAEILKQKKINFLVLSGGLEAWKDQGGQTISFGDPTSIVDQVKVKYLQSNEARDLILNPDADVFILDTRDEEQFKQGHIANSVNIPLFDIEKRREEIPSLKSIIIVGDNELQEFQAAVQIYDIKMMQGYIVKGSIGGLKSAGVEMVK